MAMPYKTLVKMDAIKRSAITSDADRFFKKIEAGEIVLTGLKILSQASLVLFWAVSSTAF